MKTLLLLIILLIESAWATEPLEPRGVPNCPGLTLLVALHPEINTMLVFPEPITMIVGEGLTDGTRASLVQFDHRKGSPVVTFKPLQTTRAVYAQIIAGETVYFCRLKPEERPDSVVTVAAPTSSQTPAAAVPVEEVFAQRLAIPVERLRQLIELSRSASVLRTPLADEYQGYESMDVSLPFREDAYETRIEKICRFPREDVTVFFGSITNRSGASLALTGLVVAVGDSRKLIPNTVTFAQATLKPGQAARFQCVLAGDGKGRRIHLSLKNRWAIQLAAISNPNVH